MIETLKQIVIEGGTINEEQAVALSQSPDKEALYKAAHQITRHFMGNKFDTCSIINAKSGNCSENCKWCAQSGHYNTVVALYPLLPAEECVHQALHNRQQGIERFGLVTSGKRLSDGEIRKLTETVRYIKQASDIKCCASLGLLNKEQLKELRESGVENYHCNIETAPSHFRTLCTTHTIEQKLETIHMAREEGFRICSGGIIGMGEIWEDRLDMAVSLAELGIDSIPINALMPIPGTPLENLPQLSEDDILRTIAFFRYINPDANIRLAAGRALLTNDGETAFQAGASATITGNMLTTVACATIRSDRKLLEDLGRDVTPDYWKEA